MQNNRKTKYYVNWRSGTTSIRTSIHCHHLLPSRKFSRSHNNKPTPTENFVASDRECVTYLRRCDLLTPDNFDGPSRRRCSCCTYFLGKPVGYMSVCPLASWFCDSKLIICAPTLALFAGFFPTDDRSDGWWTWRHCNISTRAGENDDGVGLYSLCLCNLCILASKPLFNLNLVFN